MSPPTQIKTVCTNSLRKLFLPLFCLFYREKGQTACTNCPEILCANSAFIWKGGFGGWVFPFMRVVLLCASCVLSLAPVAHAGAVGGLLNREDKSSADAPAEAPQAAAPSEPEAAAPAQQERCSKRLSATTWPACYRMGNGPRTKNGRRNGWRPCLGGSQTSGRKSSPKIKFWGRISRGRPYGYPSGRPGAKASVRPSKSWKNTHLGADIHDHVHEGGL